jgi:Raf kinase inhibitor-like YbhB/YbcL family protein
MNLIRKAPPNPYEFLPHVATFKATSNDIAEGARLEVQHVAPGAGGCGQSPHLAWSGAPQETGSYAITCFDPDAPTLCGFWHWMIADIPATTEEIPTGAATQLADLVPEARALKNDNSTTDYAGAAPPPGDRAHRYIFTIHALSVDKLHVDPGASPAAIAFRIVAATVARAHLVPTF